MVAAGRVSCWYSIAPFHLISCSPAILDAARRRFTAQHAASRWPGKWHMLACSMPEQSRACQSTRTSGVHLLRCRNDAATMNAKLQGAISRRSFLDPPSISPSRLGINLGSYFLIARTSRRKIIPPSPSCIKAWSKDGLWPKCHQTEGQIPSKLSAPQEIAERTR